MKKLLQISSMFAVIAGVIFVAGGAWGIMFTYENISREKITTPNDASIPNAVVAGPFTLRSQAEIIRHHMLTMSEGKTYAEMPRQVQKVENGKPMVDAQGKPVMVANEARNTWITATTLITALNLGIITYVFSGLVLVLGFISLWTGLVFWKLGKNQMN